MKRGSGLAKSSIEVFRCTRPADLCRQLGSAKPRCTTGVASMRGCRLRSPSGCFRWKEEENRRLEKLLAEAMLGNAALKDIASGEF